MRLGNRPRHDRELLKLEGAEGGLLNASLEVTDDAGEIVLGFPFTEAILT